MTFIDLPPNLVITDPSFSLSLHLGICNVTVSRASSNGERQERQVIVLHLNCLSMRAHVGVPSEWGFHSLIFSTKLFTLPVVSPSSFFHEIFRRSLSASNSSDVGRDLIQSSFPHKEDYHGQVQRKPSSSAHHGKLSCRRLKPHRPRTTNVVDVLHKLAQHRKREKP